MAQTIAARGDRLRQIDTTRRLYSDVYGPSSFEIDQACRLPEHVKLAAEKIADSTRQLADEADVTLALIECGERASRYTEWLGGMLVYARNRRNPI